jgi:hypothetical protein
MQKLPWEIEAEHAVEAAANMSPPPLPVDGEITPPEDDTSLGVEELSREFFALYNAATFAMEHVRIRISHAGNFKVFAMRADEKVNPCGVLELSDGSKIRVEAWGVPGPGETVLSAADIVSGVFTYIQATGLTVTG